MSDPWPTDLRYSKETKQLTVTFDDGVEHALPAEYMRVYSPSAEVRGHGPTSARSCRDGDTSES